MRNPRRPCLQLGIAQAHAFAMHRIADALFGHACANGRECVFSKRRSRRRCIERQRAEVHMTIDRNLAQQRHVMIEHARNGRFIEHITRISERHLQSVPTLTRIQHQIEAGSLHLRRNIRDRQTR
ncbi:hypothetical protein YK56LOC_36180 [Caballeronia sp. HLA56]